jgi:cell division protein FtsI/penicillin-binding protein 2
VSSFVGFAPARNPKLLVAIMVDEPQGQVFGGQVAAPAFQQIASFALPYLGIAPG